MLSRAYLSLHSAKVTCNLLETGEDGGEIGVALRDVGLFLSRDSVNPVAAAVCVADVNYLDLNLAMAGGRGEGGAAAAVDLWTALRSVRIRTCTGKEGSRNSSMFFDLT